MYDKNSLNYADVKLPKIGFPQIRPTVPDSVFEARKKHFVEQMKKKNIDIAVIYADREHYSNFKFFTGTDPRFEEALLVIHLDGTVYMVLGNECFVLHNNSAIRAEGVLCQMFSLPNQPMDKFVSVDHVLRSCGIEEGKRIGLIDWKLLRTKEGNLIKDRTFMPSYLVDEIKNVVGKSELVTNESEIMIGLQGLRLRMEAAAIAEFEFGAASASQSVLNVLDATIPGKSELELANLVQNFGQIVTTHTISASGENTRTGMKVPTNKQLKKGEAFTIAASLEGGLTCRSAVIAEEDKDMSPIDGKYYMDEIAKPYMATVFNWYEMLGLGVRCEEIFHMVKNSYPAEKYGWKLNPGHFTSYDEWSASPFYEGSEFVIESGMILQMDIIPSDPIYPACNDEDGVAIADEKLRAELERDYPDVYARIMERRKFAEEEIGLKLKPEVLPLSNSFAWYNPFILNRGKAITIKKG